MPIRTLGPCFTLAIALLAAAAHADAPPASASDVDESIPTNSYDTENAWLRAQAALYDVLAADSSPRMQVLIARVWLPNSDEPSNMLRPKRDEVISRAVSFAPDDAVVQWIAATAGTYETSACGPAAWPDEEVGNLVRLEPDNAGAWRYAVALAHAKGDEDGVDDALSRMASAPKAGDHGVEEIAAWTAVFRAHPELGNLTDTPFSEYAFDASDTASLAAMANVGTPSDSADRVLEAVCKPDASSERIWQRLGWCIDAGQRLAREGTSLAVRKSGLAMLKATGDASEETSSAQRQTDWLAANDANPMRHFFDDDPADLPASLADWRGATSEIAAIEHRLKRLGLPLSPPPAWTPRPTVPDEEDAKSEAVGKVFADYLASLLADMRANGTPLAQAFAIESEEYAARLSAIASKSLPETDEASRSAAAATRGNALASIAAANPANLKLQWFVADANDALPETKAEAIATVQQAEGDNAAAWALSLAHPPADDALAGTLLARMATSTRYDAHAIDAVPMLLEAMRRHPIPPLMLESGWWKPPRRAVSAEDGARYVAITLSYPSIDVPTDVAHACLAATTPTRRDTCIAIGRLLVHNGLDVQNVRTGEGMLRQQKSLESADAARAHYVYWWHEVLRRQERSESVGAYLDDYLATGNQVEALERNAARLGKTEPPVNWKPRRWINAE